MQTGSSTGCKYLGYQMAAVCFFGTNFKFLFKIDKILTNYLWFQEWNWRKLKIFISFWMIYRVPPFVNCDFSWWKPLSSSPGKSHLSIEFANSGGNLRYPLSLNSPFKWNVSMNVWFLTIRVCLCEWVPRTNKKAMERCDSPSFAKCSI